MDQMYSATQILLKTLLHPLAFLQNTLCNFISLKCFHSLKPEKSCCLSTITKVKMIFKDGLEEETGTCVRHGGKPELWADSEHTGNKTIEGEKVTSNRGFSSFFLFFFLSFAIKGAARCLHSFFWLSFSYMFFSFLLFASEEKIPSEYSVTEFGSQVFHVFSFKGSFDMF